MARILVTGSADGLGRLTAAQLLSQGHDVVTHVRNERRKSAVHELTEQGAAVVVGDLADLEETRGVATQVNALGAMDAVIHNAGVYTGAAVMPVNVVAPYLLTALVQRPARLVYLSSGLHRGGHPSLDRADWASGASYGDSKLFVTALAAAVARLAPAVCSNAVDPGWVPTKMGGSGAPDDLTLGHQTQAWLAASNDREARTSGGYWYHQERQAPHPAALDPAFQDELLASLADFTGAGLDLSPR
jgi:NAD(P)-dependent dehydrogenase (short-subunit alcohol dehydrogenase family)